MSRMDRKIARFQTTMGDSWWWRRYADLVDRRDEAGNAVDKFNAPEAWGYETKWQRYRKVMSMKAYQSAPVYPPLKVKREGASRPEMLPRPEGMSRQQHRRLYRESCKIAGVPWRAERLFKTPRRERGRNWKDITPELLAELEAKWASFTEESLRIE